jgi:hypothetical protein
MKIIQVETKDSIHLTLPVDFKFVQDGLNLPGMGLIYLRGIN